MLDLIWTNEVNMISCNTCDNPLLKLETHHPAIEIKLHCEPIPANNSTTSFLDFGNADYTAINESLEEMDWNCIFKGIPLYDCINKFYEFINLLIAKKIELKTKKCNNHPKWFDRNLINMKNRVNKLHRIMKSTRKIEDRNHYTSQRSEYKKRSRSAFRNFKLEMENLINDDPKKFYEYVDTCRNTHDELPTEMEYNGQKENNESNIAKCFATHFAKAYTQPNEEIIKNYNKND